MQLPRVCLQRGLLPRAQQVAGQASTILRTSLLRLRMILLRHAQLLRRSQIAAALKGVEHRCTWLQIPAAIPAVLASSTQSATHLTTMCRWKRRPKDKKMPTRKDELLARWQETKGRPSPQVSPANSDDEGESDDDDNGDEASVGRDESEDEEASVGGDESEDDGASLDGEERRRRSLS